MLLMVDNKNHHPKASQEVQVSIITKERDNARELVKQGLRPAHVRRAERLKHATDNTNTFEVIAREWMSKRRANWSPYYLRQVERCLEVSAFPDIGRLPIRSITAAHLLEILRATEERGAETVAVLLRQWCSAIFRLRYRP